MRLVVCALAGFMLTIAVWLQSLNCLADEFNKVGLPVHEVEEPLNLGCRVAPRIGVSGATH